METLMIEGRGRIDAVCDECGGLMIVHKRGQCSQSEAEKILTPETKLELLEKMEDFRQRQGKDCKLEKMLRGITVIMKEGVKEIMKI